MICLVCFTPFGDYSNKNRSFIVPFYIAILIETDITATTTRFQIPI